MYGVPIGVSPLLPHDKVVISHDNYGQERWTIGAARPTRLERLLWRIGLAHPWVTHRRSERALRGLRLAIDRQHDFD